MFALIVSAMKRGVCCDWEYVSVSGMTQCVCSRFLDLELALTLGIVVFVIYVYEANSRDEDDMTGGVVMCVMCPWQSPSRIALCLVLQFLT